MFYFFWIEGNISELLAELVECSINVFQTFPQKTRYVLEETNFLQFRFFKTNLFLFYWQIFNLSCLVFFFVVLISKFEAYISQECHFTYFESFAFLILSSNYYYFIFCPQHIASCIVLYFIFIWLIKNVTLKVK